MLRSYFKIAFRSLLNNKVFSLINILGLALGISCFILLSLFILDELSYDSFHKNADRIYRVYVHSDINGKETNNSKSAAALGATLLKDFPEVHAYTRIGYFGTFHFRYKDKTFRERSIYTADSTYFSVFSFPFLYGNSQTALNQPNSIVLTEKTSNRYFGNENPVGKSFLVDGRRSFLITGVMKDFPPKSHFRCDALLSMSTYPEANSNYWLDLHYTTYIVLKEGAQASVLALKMQKTVKDYVGPQVEKALGVSLEQFLTKGNAYDFRLQPLTSIYLYSKTKYGIDSNTEWGNLKTGDVTYVYIFGAVALFILLIACINFMNLSTARSEKRAKEVGIKKALGSKKSTLIGQFITESVLMTAIAVLFSLVLLRLVLPEFNALANRQLTLELTKNSYTIPALLFFTLAVGFLAGSYPAFVLSSFRPIEILKSGVKKRKLWLRNVLVITQFAISISLIIGMIVIRSQLSYIQHKDLGFSKDHLLSIDNAVVLGDKIKVFKEELLKNPKITAVTNASLMFSPGIPGSGYLFNKRSGTDPILFQFLDVDYDFIKTFDLQLTQGRFFSNAFSTDSTAVIMNEAALKECRTTDVLNKTITKISDGGESKTYTVVGVVKDFNYESLHKEIRPLIFHLSAVRQASSILNIRIHPDNASATLRYIEDTWHAFTQEEKCRYNFLDQNLARLYETERKVSVIATVFSFLAIFIACLGLFGLAVLVAEQRTKEIGIRKILGASLAEIVFTISKQFVLWVGIANLIAWPVMYYIMHNWLNNFAYKIEMSWWMFTAAGVLALVIALATISTQSIKAALVNPVKSLKTE
ncbi:ABC transporter permease [Runella sp.]|uniref:ABC transporter permease n=1 Tax=Runella sp. TaxID=1960881 RepID=UPI003D15142B